MASSVMNLLFFASIATMAMTASSVQFEVGDKMGWRKPSDNEHGTYNEWAGSHRFRVGDSIYFKYKKDSVVQVSAGDYSACNTSSPIAKFDDGNTVFEFDRPGFFYFVSGHHSHCEAGQKMIVGVMHTSDSDLPVLAPNSENSTNSGDKLKVISYHIAAVASLLLLIVP